MSYEGLKSRRTLGRDPGLDEFGLGGSRKCAWQIRVLGERSGSGLVVAGLANAVPNSNRIQDRFGFDDPRFDLATNLGKKCAMNSIAAGLASTPKREVSSRSMQIAEPAPAPYDMTPNLHI